MLVLTWASSEQEKREVRIETVTQTGPAEKGLVEKQLIGVDKEIVIGC